MTITDMISDSLPPEEYSDGYGQTEWFASVQNETTERRKTCEQSWTDFIKALRDAPEATVRVTGNTLDLCRAEFQRVMDAASAVGLHPVTTRCAECRGGFAITSRMVRT